MRQPRVGFGGARQANGYCQGDRPALGGFSVIDAGQTGINDGVNEGTQTGIAYREIATGGSIPIIVDWSGLHSRSVMDVYTVTGYASNAHVDVKTAIGDDPSISTLTVSADGCVVAAASGVEPATGAMSFSGMTLDAEGQSTGTLAAMRTGSGHATGLGATATYKLQETSSAGFEALVGGFIRVEKGRRCERRPFF